MSGGRGRRRAPSLACVVQALEGGRVVVELRGDTVLRGTLLAADDALNLQLSGCTVQPLDGPARAAPYLYVRGRQVRYVHLPGALDPGSAVRDRRRAAAAARTAASATPAARLEKGQQLELGQAGGPLPA